MCLFRPISTQSPLQMNCREGLHQSVSLRIYGESLTQFLSELWLCHQISAAATFRNSWGKINTYCFRAGRSGETVDVLVLTCQPRCSASTVDQVEINFTSVTRHAGNLHTGSVFLIDLHIIWPLKPVKPPMGWPEAKTHMLIDKCMHI